jgi:hypothetical protein
LEHHGTATYQGIVLSNLAVISAGARSNRALNLSNPFVNGREAVAQIKVPTLVIYGGHNSVVPPSDSHFLAEQVVGMLTVDRVRGLVKEEVGRGAKVLLSGEPQETIMPAVIVDHVTPKMQTLREESFGLDHPPQNFGRSDHLGE